MAIVHNGDCLLSRAIQAALSSHHSVSESLVDFLEEILSMSEMAQVEDVVEIAKSSQLDSEKIKQLLFSHAVNSSLAEHLLFCRAVLDLQAGQNALLSNGKVSMM